jgi:hypothetical protein
LFANVDGNGDLAFAGDAHELTDCRFMQYYLSLDLGDSEGYETGSFGAKT